MTEPQKKEKEQERARSEFRDSLDKIRETRSEYRGLLFDAMQERNNILRARQLAKRDDLRAKRKLDEVNNPKGLDGFFFWFFIVQIALITMWILFTGFEDTPGGVAGATGAPYPWRMDNGYSVYMSVVMFVLVGLGLVVNTMRNYTWTSLSSHFMLVAITFEMAIITMGFFQWIENQRFWIVMELNSKQLLNAMYCAASVLISYAAFIGLVVPEAAMFIACAEVFWYALNQWVCVGVLEIIDTGGAVTVHTFGAAFGLGVALIVGKFTSPANDNWRDQLKGAYHSDMWAYVGALFLFITMPAFNAYLNITGVSHRLALNTIIATSAGAVTAGCCNRLFNTGEGGVFSVKDMTVGIWVGGLAVASGHNLLIQPWVALLLGILYGAICTALHHFVATRLQEMRIDIMGVISRHLIPGFLTGIFVAPLVIHASSDVCFDQHKDDLFPRSDGSNHAGNHAAAAIISLLLALLSGLLTGGVTKVVGTKLFGRPRLYYWDDKWASIPHDFD